MVLNAKDIVKAINASSKRSSAVRSFTDYAAANINRRLAERRTVLDLPRLKGIQKNFGWVRLEYTDPTGRMVAFNVRPKFLKELQEQKPSHWDPMAERAYKKWREETGAGQLYGIRRQIEGMLKTAERKGNDTIAANLRKLLKGDPEKMRAWYEHAQKVITNVQWDEFFNYDVFDDDSGLQPEDFEV